jgi:hypothetical protein
MPDEKSPDEQPLIRGVGTLGATALNMIDMIGVGTIHYHASDHSGDGRPAGVT